MRTRIDETTLRSLARERIVRRMLREEDASADQSGALSLYGQLTQALMGEEESQPEEAPKGMSPKGLPSGMTGPQAIGELINAAPDKGLNRAGEVVDYIGPQLGAAIKRWINGLTLVNAPFKVSNPNNVPTEWQKAVESGSVPEVELLNPDGSPSGQKEKPVANPAGLYRYLYGLSVAEFGMRVSTEFLEKADGWYQKVKEQYILKHERHIDGYTNIDEIKEIGEDVLEIVMQDRTPTLMMAKLYLAGFAYENSTVEELVIPTAIGLGTAAAVLGLLYFTGGAGLGVFGGAGTLGGGGAASVGGVSLAVPAAVPIIGGAGIAAGVTTGTAAKAAGMILAASVIGAYGTTSTIDLTTREVYGPYSEMRAALDSPENGEYFLGELAREVRDTFFADSADEYKRDRIADGLEMLAKADAGQHRYDIIDALREGSK